jgi:hypothetical protein
MCQLKDLDQMGTLSRADASLEGVRDGLKKIRRVAITLRKRLSSRGTAVPVPFNPEKREIGPQDKVRVRSREEILSALDEEGKYGGCKFMRGMYEHCGKTYRVLKNVDFFFDEARQKMVKTKDLVILEGAICSGQQRLFFNRCDRNCFFFWHKAWLEKAK